MKKPKACKPPFNAIIRLGVCLFCISMLTACSSGRQDTSIRIGFFPNITHAQALLGMAGRTFEKALGTKIDWKRFNAGSAEIEALMAGEVDIGYIGPGPAINGYVKTHGDLQVIAGAADGGAVLVCRQELPISNVRQLSGKKVAVPQYGNTQDLTLRLLLAQNGLKDTTKGGTVEIVQAENPDIETLFDRGAIDAALVPEPWGARLEKEAHARLILKENQIWRDGHYPTALVVARADFIKAHPDLIQRFIHEHARLTGSLVQHEDASIRIIGDQIRILTHKTLPEDVLKTAYKRLTFTTNPEPAALVELAEFSNRLGYYRTKPDLAGLFNPATVKIISYQKN